MRDHIIDAEKKPLGRMASEIALILQGKKSPKYNPRLIGEDRVLVKNVGRLFVTGRIFKEKKYFRPTGDVGHLKMRTFEQQFLRDPKKVLREAVRRMLPKNFLNQKRLNNLIFVEDKK